MAFGSQGPDPVVRRRRLRNELRKAREAANMNQRDVAQAMDWSQSKLIRIETGAVSISTNDLRALLTHYGTPRERIDALVELARAAREMPRWSIYRDVTEQDFIAYLGYESSASIVRNFEPLLVPGLLQTEEYANEVISVIEENQPHKIEALVDLRMQRQEIFTKEDAPQLHFIIDEAVLHRVVGGLEVTRRQLCHLRTMADLPNVTIRVVPFTAGIYPHMRGPYVILEFPDPEDESVLLLENPIGPRFVRETVTQNERGVDPVALLGAFWRLEQLAPVGDLPRVIDEALKRLDGAPAAG